MDTFNQNISLKLVYKPNIIYIYYLDVSIAWLAQNALICHYNISIPPSHLSEQMENLTFPTS